MGVYALTVKFPVYNRVLSTFAVLVVSLYVQPIILVRAQNGAIQ